MTDINLDAAAREALLTTAPAGTAAGVVREALMATATAAMTAGAVREVLLWAPPPVVVSLNAQTVISINTG
jgi:hypothetical protein